jgi:hypothetical protein
MKLLKYALLLTTLAAGFAVLPFPAERALAASSSCPGGQVMRADSRVCCPADAAGSASGCLYAKYINPIIRILSFIAGLAAIIGIIIGGIQYASSGGDPQKTAAGKGKVTKAIYGLIAFMFLYSALQFFSPGGISSNSAPAGGLASAETCSKTFLGLKPWFAYLPKEAFDSDCSIAADVKILGTGKDSVALPVTLVIVDDLLKIAGLVAVVYVITGGIKLTTSQGEPDKTKMARESIINALIGLVVAVVAAAVVSYIGSQLSK